MKLNEVRKNAKVIRSFAQLRPLRSHFFDQVPGNHDDYGELPDGWHFGYGEFEVEEGERGWKKYKIWFIFEPNWNDFDIVDPSDVREMKKELKKK